MLLLHLGHLLVFASIHLLVPASSLDATHKLAILQITGQCPFSIPHPKHTTCPSEQLRVGTVVRRAEDPIGTLVHCNV